MITLALNYEVLPDRLVTITLPEGVPAGRHDLVVVLDEKESEQNPAESRSGKLMRFAGTVTAFNSIDGVA
ncbi:MAG: hypothetical protein ACOYLR_07550 [Chlorobium sp.]